MPATTAKPIQRKLPLTVEVRIPLMDVAAVRGVLGAEFNQDDVLDLIDLGLLPWSWNLAVREAGRREIRVLAACVKHYQLTGGFRPFPDMTEAQVWKLILPHDKPFVESIDLATAFNATSDLLLDLIRAGLLQRVDGTECRRGRGGSPLVSRDSVVTFLKSRRIQ
ncbi:MAG: hypothetical protein JWR69_921 [Pedosphaera sp.]|nr:hypothetical protein [Pedosphaera sp.]